MSDASRSEEAKAERIALILHPSDTKNTRLLEPHFILVGRVAAAWAALEHLINGTIWSLAEVSPHIGICMTSQFTTVQSRARALLSLFRWRGGDEALAKKVNKFLTNEVDPLGQERNRIVHDPLGIIEAEQLIVRVNFTADRRLDARVKVDAFAEAQNTLNKIIPLIDQWRALSEAMVASLPASAKISPEPPP
jgi:hypothetical protein